MALNERANVCIGCGEEEGDTHKPGCERYTSSPIVRTIDTPNGQNPDQPLPYKPSADDRQGPTEMASRLRAPGGLLERKPPSAAAEALDAKLERVEAMIPGPDSPRGIPGPLVGGVPVQLQRAAEKVQEEEPSYTGHGPWEVRAFVPVNPMAGTRISNEVAAQRSQAAEIEAFLNKTEHYALQGVHSLPNGTVLVIGKRYGRRAGA